MPRIAQESIDRVRNAADILDVVSQVVDLKKRGRNYFGLCPFHHEKTPSFSVAPDKEIYHCFGCGRGGNAINFIMEYEKIDFIDAIRKLAQQYGIELKITGSNEPAGLRARLYEIHEKAQAIFHESLFSAAGNTPREYIKNRNLSESLIRQFGIGYARDSFDYLLKVLRGAGFTDQEVLQSGLVTKTEKGIFDRFRNRIMFPIYDPQGKVIAFGGRALNPDEPAKYLNSPDTRLYRKSDVFYGMHATRPAIRDARKVIIVEGYTDFLRLYESGLTTVVAVSGTALTEQHVNHLRKLVQTAYLLYDGDSAGVSAAIRAGYLLLKGGVEPRMICPPRGLDPDDWVQEAGKEAVETALESAEELIPFQVQTGKIKEKSAREQSAFVDDVLQQIATIQDSLIRTELIRELSQHLAVEEEDLVRRFQNIIRRRRNRRQGPEPESAPKIRFTTRSEKAQLELIKILASPDKALREKAKDIVRLDWFTNSLLHRLAEILLPIYGDEISFASILDAFEDEAEHRAVSELFATLEEQENGEQILQECVRTLKIEPLRDTIKQLRLEIRQREQAGEDSTDLAVKVALLQNEINALMI
ncbi:MAG: DNA primase [Fidelibacterota bacterium]